MTTTSSLRKVIIMVMCVAMMLCVMASTASAVTTDQDIDVKFYKTSDPTQFSMANGIVAGTAFYDIGTQELTIPLQVLAYAPGAPYDPTVYYGYIDEIKVDTDNNLLNGYEVIVAPASTPYPSGGTIAIPLASSLVTNGATFTVSFGIDLYDDADGTDPAAISHINNTAIMKFDFV
ncbi:hypothetical protein Sgly_1482 [Syntrophobotulus glycolicus DSM 8271]|uniref:Uncharacterized protein n=1 Tax=Syntrophobotulus glycolicus (strain DSM 8271 / FlGlyR) TaxID=645991 RepID=F0SX00_SYNGF|nr:hypothetical protein [Syntrophobotulus glycolicus]ADY55783.1 hypothetical protein Sgly_1482 [Syntrophobotulus glycolicus DSM 8271]